jgi:predicted enzyme related to lactoylglutathione lyase
MVIRPRELQVWPCSLKMEVSHISDAQTRRQVLDLTAKGFAGTLFLTTDDVQAAYKELSGRGVNFVEQPEQRPYGIDSAFRDPSGNTVRLTQLGGA